MNELLTQSLLLTRGLLSLSAIILFAEILALFPRARCVWTQEDLIGHSLTSSLFRVNLLKTFYHPRLFYIANIVALILAISLLLIPHWSSVLGIFIVAWWTSCRWKGRFNGGSDSMFLFLLAGLLAIELAPGDLFVAKIALYFVAVQSLLSYFLAGFYKLTNNNWRTGQALKLFLQLPFAQSMPAIDFFVRRPSLLKGFSWFIIIFELSFPLVLLKPQLLPFVFSLGFLFHLANYFVFGLNRFFWLWMSTYPAIYFTAKTIL